MAKKKTSTKASGRSAAPKKPAASAGPATAAARIVILHGPEAQLRAIHTEKLREALAAAHGEIDVLRFDGASAQAADVLDECRSFGLVQQHKLVIVDEAEKFVREETRPLLERYAKAPAEQATLVLRADTWRAGKIDKLVEEVGAIIPCEPLDPAKAMAWAVARTAKHHRAALEPAAAEALIDRLGTDLGRLDSELGKLAVAAATPGEDSPTITPAMVADMVGATREDEAFPFQATLAAGDPEAILAGLDNLTGVSRQDPVFLAFVAEDCARQMHTAARLLRAGANPWQAAVAAKIWGAGKDAMIARAQKADPDDLAELFLEGVHLDARLKSGRAEPRRAVEAYALRFTSRRRA